jgi:hypothetical protein
MTKKQLKEIALILDKALDLIRELDAPSDNDEINMVWNNIDDAIGMISEIEENM